MKFSTPNDILTYQVPAITDKIEVLVGMGTCGIGAGAQKVYDELKNLAVSYGDRVQVKPVGCLGLCFCEPNVEVKVPGLPSILYGKVDAEFAKSIMDNHVANGKILNQHIYDKPYIDVLAEPVSVSAKVVLVSGVKKDLFKAIETAVNELNMDYQVLAMESCGLFSYGSIVKIFPSGQILVGLDVNSAPNIVKAALKGESVPDQHLYKNTQLDAIGLQNQAFYHKQLRLVLRNCGIIDTTSADGYLARKGYQGIAGILANKTPDDVINEMKTAGLRGRGGAGFPTWLKWKFTKDEVNETKYIICNADEGDPGAYMDRSVLEGDPHSVLEGMMIGAYAIGATKGFIYARAEYGLAIKRLDQSIQEAKSLGLLGNNILGSNFSFDIEIRLGAGAFVCGEETALIASIEGSRGMPRPRPPFPAVKGLWGKPTVINNVESLANIPLIFIKGGAWYSKIGTEKSTGTKVFALTGKVKRTGLVEVPMGITLKEIIYDIGGGIFENRDFKAVQTGGPSGGVIPHQHIDTPISYETLQTLGSIMGSGGMIVMDTTDCMVDVSKFYLQFIVDESCGKCAPCRQGGFKLLDILDQITKGNGKPEDVASIEAIALAMQKASLCGLGQTATNPVVSVLRYFKDEFIAHINDKKCRAGKCKNLSTYSIDANACTGCHVCAMKCPVNAISGERKQPHVINQEICIKCGECYKVCKFNAVIIN